MAVSNPIILFQTGAKVSATLAGAIGSSSAWKDKRYRQGTFRSPTISTIGVKSDVIAPGGDVAINLFDGSLLGADELTPVPLRKLLYADLAIADDSAGGFLRLGGYGAGGHPLWLGSQADTYDVFPNGPIYAQGDPSGAYFVVVDNTHKFVKIANPHGTLAVTYVLRVAGLLS